jgi:hypothetical protein
MPECMRLAVLVENFTDPNDDVLRDWRLVGLARAAFSFVGADTISRLVPLALRIAVAASIAADVNVRSRGHRLSTR